MSTRSSLLESIADTVQDYRAEEIEAPSPSHVDEWVSQFNPDYQIQLLTELNHTLGHSYFSKSWIEGFYANHIRHEGIAGETPCDYWRTSRIFNIQEHGHSQSELIEMFGQTLLAQCGVELSECGSHSGEYLYLDDFLFTGSRIGNDLSSWIRDLAPAKSTVNILLIAAHKFGEWKSKERLYKAARDAGKELTLNYWAALRLENRKAYRDSSEVLWPAFIPEYAGLPEYLADEKKFPFTQRQPGGHLKYPIFSSETGRQLLEEQFLIAGMRIRSFCMNPSPSLRPLGFSPFGLGFGSMIASFRNCPNNAPLALWWGDASISAEHPLGRWKPLLPRKTYSMEGD